MLSDSVRFLATHPVARRAPLRTLLRIARWQIVSRARRQHVMPWISGSRVFAERGMTGITGNLYVGLHEFFDMAFFAHLLRPGDLFVDGGANVGSYTLIASSVCGASTIAIEPSPESRSMLERNVALNRIERLVEIDPHALAATSGTARLTPNLGTQNHLIDSSTNTPSIAVPLARLDDLIGARQPTAIKLDLEGGEEAALAGAGELLLDRCLIAIEVETVTTLSRKLLEGSGLREATYDPWNRELALGEKRAELAANHLFVRDLDEVRSRLREASPLDVYGLQV